MSIFSSIGKALNFIPHELEKLTSKAYHSLTGTPTSKEKREQRQLLNSQIAEYKKQTELSRQEMKMAKDSQDFEKRRIQEKQIRAIRRHSSSRGFLGSSGEENDPGINSKLGA